MLCRIGTGGLGEIIFVFSRSDVCILMGICHRRMQLIGNNSK